MSAGAGDGEVFPSVSEAAAGPGGDGFEVTVGGVVGDEVADVSNVVWTPAVEADLNSAVVLSPSAIEVEMVAPPARFACALLSVVVAAVAAPPAPDIDARNEDAKAGVGPVYPAGRPPGPKPPKGGADMVVVAAVYPCCCYSNPAPTRRLMLLS